MGRRRLAVAVCGGLVLTAVFTGTSVADDDERRVDADYIADIHVVPGDGTPRDTVTGVVFDDRNRNGVQDGRRERGVRDVAVSNGREVVRTDRDGRYTLPAYDDMTVFVSKPADRAVPFDENLVPQFAYAHKPAGSPDALRFGGLPPTGPLPAEINFPTIEADDDDEFSCLAVGDTQTYSGAEIAALRDSLAADLAGRDTNDAACMLLLGDVMGDDLDLLPRLTDVMGTVGLPQYYAHGNHDFDFDARSDADSADSWRSLYGPTYYSFDVGDVHFVTLDNVVYPCTPADNPDGTRGHCDDPENNPRYTGKIGEQQLAWLANDLAGVDEDKLIVFSHHIPLLSFVDNAQTPHQTADLARLYEIVGDRPAISLSGHTHTIENLLPGDRMAGWPAVTGVESPKFPHLVAGAASGHWYTGDLDIDGVPMAIGRLGEPRGYFSLDFDGAEVATTFHATGQPRDRQMALGFNTPQYRDWFTTLTGFYATNPPADAVPPVNVNDLADTRLFTPADLAAGVSLTANVWAGSTDSTVRVQINDDAPVELTRTQDFAGEEVRRGVEFSDPWAVVRQLQVARFAFESTSGDERAQGYEAFRGRQFGPGPPNTIGLSAIADKSGHLWTLPLPADLPVGAHVAEVTHTDRHGQVFVEQTVFEVREERPAQRFRTEVFADGN